MKLDATMPDDTAKGEWSDVEIFKPFGHYLEELYEPSIGSYHGIKTGKFSCQLTNYKMSFHTYGI